MSPPKSNLWKYFKKLSEQKDFVKCKVCSKIIKTSGNTSNLKCHLKSMHKQYFDILFGKKESLAQTGLLDNTSTNKTTTEPNTPTSPSPSTSAASSMFNFEFDDNIDENLYSETEQSSISSASSSQSKKFQRQATVKETFGRFFACQEGGWQYNKITNAILYMICCDYQPLSIVEDKGFKNLLRVAAPHYKIPSRKTVNQLLENKYNAISESLKKKILDLEHYSITTDIWTDTQQSRSFLGTTLHFADNTTLSSFVLGVSELNERHTSDYLIKELNKVFEFWGIENSKVTVAVSDGAQNITKALEILFGKKRHLHCFAHQLNLVVDKALESNRELKQILKKIKDIVTWFKQSNNASDELRKSQGTNAMKLIQEVPTRWNSTFYMVERFLQLREIVNQIVNRHPSAPIMITAQEVLIISEIQTLLQPFEAATKEIGGQKYTTSSLVIPMTFNLHKKILKCLPQFDIGKTFKEDLIKQCIKRFFPAEQTYLLQVATLLDPRFKNIYFRDPTNCAKAVQCIEELIQGEDTKPLTAVEIVTTEQPVSSSFDLWADHSLLVEAKSSKVDCTSFTRKSRLSEYLIDPVFPLRENPLEIWQKISGLYPGIFKTATKFVSCVATSVPAERLFSKAGQTVTQKRNRLKGKKLSMLLFLQSVDSGFWEL